MTQSGLPACLPANFGESKGISVDPRKVTAINEFPLPTTKVQLQQFLGTAAHRYARPHSQLLRHRGGSSRSDGGHSGVQASVDRGD